MQSKNRLPKKHKILLHVDDKYDIIKLSIEIDFPDGGT